VHLLVKRNFDVFKMDGTTMIKKCRSCFKVKAGGTFINHHAVKD